MGDQKSSKKRNLSVFDAIKNLESEDLQAETQRRKKSTAQANRSKAAQSQTKIYNHLVECRILLQRAVTSTETSPTLTTTTTSEEIVESCNGILESLLLARQQLLTGVFEAGVDSDVNEYSELVRSQDNKELQDTLQQEYETCREEWKQVLNRRHQDLKLHSGLTAKSQFRVVDSSFWQQVDATVEYETLRRQTKGIENDDTNEVDDSKVYQQLLKDFVAHSAAATVSNGTEGVGRLKATKTNQSKKTQMDRRASKGRKIRYKEIPKLVNFTFPLSRPNTSTLDQDEWFQSLFGGAGKK